MSSAEPALPSGYTQRPATLDDIDAIGALFRRSEDRLGMRPESAEAFLRWAFGLPFVELARDSVVIEFGGDPSAFGGVMRDPAQVGSSLDWFGVVDPAHLGRSLGTWIVRWAMGVADGREPTEGPSRRQTNIPAPDEDAHRLLAVQGFTQIRTMWSMHRDVRGVVRSAPPAGVTIRRFEPGRDERTFWEVSDAAFEGHFGHVPTSYESFEADWYRSHDWNPDQVLLAELEGVVVGELAWVEAGDDGYIASVGVLEASRGRGIGTSLLHAAFADIAEAGFANATLGVDTENATGAVRVYRSAGMQTVRESHVFQQATS